MGQSNSKKPSTSTAKPSASLNKKAGGAKKRKKGNPSRKSQWATNPLYSEYKRLKKIVETQAKAQKVSFNLVQSDEKTAYDAALNNWFLAKSSFRKPSKTQESSDGEETEPEAEAAGEPSGEARGPNDVEDPQSAPSETDDASSSDGDFAVGAEPATVDIDAVPRRSRRLSAEVPDSAESRKGRKVVPKPGAASVQQRR